MARRYYACGDCGAVFHLQHAKLREALMAGTAECLECGALISGAGSKRKPNPASTGRVLESIGSVARGSDPAAVVDKLLD